MKEGSGTRRMLLAAALMLGAWGLGSIAILVPLHEYDWADEPGMKALVRPEAALTILALSAGGLALAAGALAVAFRMKGRRGSRLLVMGAAALALLVCGARLAEVLPVYSG